MPNPPRRVLERPWIDHLLLVLTLAHIAVQPIGGPNAELYSRIVFGLVLVGAMMAVSGRKRLFAVGLALGIPALLALIFQTNPRVEGPSLLLGIGTLAFVCAVLLMRIYERPQVNAASVSISLVVYLFLGLIWSMAYQFVENVSPDSFYGLGDAPRRELLYYSFVTLTTLGYGDIGPAAPVARSLAITEAIVGQLYLVVLVASLVGMFLGQGSKSRGN